ncbi:MAG: alpha/beta hydrolase fold domain-containing protein, partial [Planctomycetes bacterium]|nr:alpha/beta hydrolase fold domain-containing protein [Planctomycetota bacterium]
MYQPDRSVFPGPRPAIVFFFGGGWRAGSPQQFQNQCRYLAGRGMVAVTADYRVKSRQDASPFDCVQDAKSAIRWVRQQSGKLGVDPERIVASGGSAGGHIACCTGVIEGMDASGEDLSISSVPDAMALFNPAVMLAPFGDEKLMTDEKLKDIAERIPGDAATISPIHHVRENLPPTIIFHGTDDTAVPFVTVQRFTQLMNERGNRCELKVYPGQPHGFFNPRFRSEETKKRELKSYRQTVSQLDAFLVSLGYLERPEDAAALSKNVTARGRLINSFRTFENKKSGHVAFLGGSITEMNGYRPMLMEFLTQRFPQTQFQFTNAGIASTCSTTGAFRLERDVLSQGPVDLLFVEFAVNDDQDAMHSREECVRGMEGIIRHLRISNPSADMVMTFFVNPGMLEQIQNGEVPLPMAEHQKVADLYQVPTIHLAREVAEQIDRGDLTWKQFGGTHPAPYGNRIAADLIEQLLTDQWNQGGDPQPHQLPKKMLDNFSYVSAHFVDLESAADREGWTIEVPDWKS